MRTLSYVLVAAVASAVTFFLFGRPASKLDQLESLLQEKFIGEIDQTAMEDAAADAMVQALGDRWSYYIPADEYASYKERKRNEYVGIGVTISVREDGTGFDILQVEPDGSAKEAGVLPGDILTEVDGQLVSELGTNGARELIQGKAGTEVSVGILRNGEKMTFRLKRKVIDIAVATGQMLDNNVGYVTIANFNDKCCEETVAAVEQLLEQGAQALIFDVRNNGGGYLSELIDLLDYLLPEGVIFREVDYTGREKEEKSDADCVEIPMAVMVNSGSYSAAEFFAAALEEYDWAIVAGDPTSGKGYYQNTYTLNDGSAVGVSIGKYFTPNGVSLQEVGGLVPEVLVELDEQTSALLSSGALAPEEDPQLQAAIRALLGS